MNITVSNPDFPELSTDSMPIYDGRVYDVAKSLPPGEYDAIDDNGNPMWVQVTGAGTVRFRRTDLPKVSNRN